jgi:hypothetical protein
MQFDDFFSDRETQACSGRRLVLTPEGLEKRRSIGFRHAFAVILHLQPDPGCEAHQNGPAFGLGAERIIEQIDHHALQSATIATHGDGG